MQASKNSIIKDKTVVILQVRMNSSRLPAKAVSIVNDYPAFILSALRLSNDGKKIIIATSCEPSDDIIQYLSNIHKIECFRGPLNNVLQRYVQALKGYSDDTIVVRVTADNIVPDGEFLSEVIEEFIDLGVEYITTTGNNGLPYGLSAEVTYAKYLREANSFASSDYELEHVTPWVISKYGIKVFEKYSKLSMNQYRVTIDTPDDLYSIKKLFNSIIDPVNISWKKVLEILQEIKETNKSPNNCINRLVMGTAQLGFPYGINRQNSPTKNDSILMIKKAIKNGVIWFDTANAYIESESILGSSLADTNLLNINISTKLDPLINFNSSDPEKLIINTIEKSLLNSCYCLQKRKLDVVMLHRVSHIDKWNGVVLRTLREWKKAGKIKTLGASVQNVEELDNILLHDDICHIQLPYNILDHRWDASISKIEKLKLKKDLTIHIRSPLLQGLLISNNPSHWKRANIQNHDEIIRWLTNTAQLFKQDNIAELCINWCKSQEWADGVVIGADCMEQLMQNIEFFKKPNLTKKSIKEIAFNRHNLDEISLNPALWQQN